MSEHKTTAKIVGVLFITAMASSILSGEYLDPLFNSNGLLHDLSDQGKAITGSLFLVSLAISVVSIPIVLYPVLRVQDESLAIGYIIARIFEGAFDLVMAFIPLLQLSLSRNLDKVLASSSEQIGLTLLATTEWVTILENIPYCNGAVLLNYLLYRSKLVPRWLSVWGLASAILFLGTVPFRLYGLVPPWTVALAFPIVLNEMVLAFWLITKGFAEKKNTVKMKREYL